MNGFGQVEENFFIAGQVDKAALEHAAAIGVKLVINNRPDGEAPDQPTSDEVAGWADELGLAYRQVAIAPNTLDEEAVRDFGLAREEVDGRGLAFCRTGARSSVLWAIDKAARLGAPADELLSAADAAGYDIKALHPLLEKLNIVRERSDR